MNATERRNYMEEAARTMGGWSADAFTYEFGQTPQEAGKESVGDWDSSAWSMAWHDLKEGLAEDEDYDAALKAWNEGFWI